jgi:hypothetical protein
MSAPSASRLQTALALAWALLLAGALVGPWLVASPTLGDDRTRFTVRVALLFYALAAGLMLFLDQAGWRAGTTPGRLARACWALGVAAFLVHVGLAFHYYHGWSHAEALRHVEKVSGFGPGIFFSYLFTLLWSADATWWLLAPGAYAARPAWAGWALHGYLAFMTFNATVVYESGPVRWAGLAGFLILGALIVVSRRRARPAPFLGELPS